MMKSASYGFAVALALSVFALSPVQAQRGSKPDSDMKAVLNQLAALKPKPIEKLTPAQARKQPSPADAVKALMKKKGIKAKSNLAKVVNTTMPGASGPIPVRIYTPKGQGPFPVVVYAHGGGWVIATNDTYDATPRALAEMTGAIFVSVEYRKAPEHPFPAAHEDVYAVLQHVMKSAGKMGGDPTRVAIMGESAGANMASAACKMARDRGGMMPIYQALVYPVADGDLSHPSYQENARAKPLNKAMIVWFTKYTIKKPADKKSPYFVIAKGNLKGLPPAIVVTAQIDPLHDEGKAYARLLEKAGVPVRYEDYKGVTHEFFGMGAVVQKAKKAEMFVADGLRTAFAPK